MKTYNLKDFESLDNLMSSMATELGGLLVSTKVTGKFGEGSIVSVVGSKSNFGCGFTAYIEYPTEVKCIQLNLALKSGALKMSEDKVELINQYQAVLDIAAQEQAEIDKAEAERLEALRKAAEEAEVQRIKAEKAKAKYDSYVRTTLDKLENLPKNKINIEDSFYGALGWLVSNMTRVSAAMPDFCERWFRGIFGDVKARVVDQSKKSPGGWTSQWGLSLTIALKTSAKNNIPACLKQYTDRNKSQDIADTQFVFTLLEDYGFNIGSSKEQNIEEIRKYIPTKFLPEFEAGLVA